MVDISKLKVGQKVHYQPDHYKETGEYENGIVKEIPEHSPDSARVVYNCNGNWDNYRDYTSAMTNGRDLNKGWVMKKYCITVSRIVPEEALSYKDAEDNPSGMYYETALSEDKALDSFHSEHPISILEHFEILVEEIDEEVVE